MLMTVQPSCSKNRRLALVAPFSVDVSLPLPSAFKYLAAFLADLLRSSDEDCHCGTDGGLLNGEGTFGFNWADATLETILVEAMGRVPGQPTVMSSTRAELCGILGALTYLRLVIEYYVLEPYISEALRFVLFCDSKGAIRRVENLATAGFTTTRRCRNHYDLEAAIALCLERLPVSVNLHWVKGHAERRKKPDSIPGPSFSM